MAGTSSVPMAIAVATDEPEIAEKTIVASTQTKAMPPRTPPIQL